MAIPPQRATQSTTATTRKGGSPPLNRAQIQARLQADPAWQVMAVDGLAWIEPYTGTPVPAPFGVEEPAIAWLLQQQPWRQHRVKAVAELQALRWFHWLKATLPDPEAGWLRQFLPDGRWLNPFNGQPVAGIPREGATINLESLRHLAEALRVCPQAQSGKPLPKEALAARLAELVPRPPREVPREPARETPRETAREAPREAPREIPREVPREIPRESSRSLPRPLSPPTEPAVKVVSGYRILGQLGTGGMSTVYRAEQLSMQRAVALKVLDHHGPPDPAYTERFLREARAAGRINHPNVVTCYDVGVYSGSKLYMAMELVTGGDATALAARHGGKLPLRLALGLMKGAARGLGAIHAAGLIHRDIKPANLFIAADGTCKLGDLGLVRDAEAATGNTMVGETVGTPAFMSPEQAQGVSDLDIRSDICALGTSLWALIAGRPPYHGDTVYQLIQQVVHAAVPDLRDVRPDCTSGVAALLNKAMAKERSRRHQTPAELLAAIDEAIAGLDDSSAARVRVEDPRTISLPPGTDRLREARIRLAELRGRGLTTTLALGTSVLAITVHSGAMTLAQMEERLQARLRGHLAALRGAGEGGDPTPATLARSLHVDGLASAVLQIDLNQRLVTAAVAGGGRAVLLRPGDERLLTDMSLSRDPAPFGPGTVAALIAGLPGKPLALWGTLVARSDQSADSIASAFPLIAEGAAIQVLAAEP